MCNIAEVCGVNTISYCNSGMPTLCSKHMAYMATTFSQNEYNVILMAIAAGYDITIDKEDVCWHIGGEQHVKENTVEEVVAKIQPKNTNVRLFAVESVEVSVLVLMGWNEMLDAPIWGLGTVEVK